MTYEENERLESYCQFKLWEDSGWSKSETPNSKVLVEALKLFENQLEVRCKSCKYLTKSESTNRLYCLYHSEEDTLFETTIDDYCSCFIKRML